MPMELYGFDRSLFLTLCISKTINFFKILFIEIYKAATNLECTLFLFSFYEFEF